MDIKELRIGNLACEPVTNRIGIVVEITENSVTLKFEFSTMKVFNNKGLSEVSINPVPLTEQWFLNFGFEKEEYTKRFAYSSDRLYIPVDFHGNDFSFSYSGCECWESSSPDTELKYVHQLQNLYFALTGQELTIKQHETNS